MSVKVVDIRKELVFTEGMRPLTIERLDPQTGQPIRHIHVRMCNAQLQLHSKLPATDLWTYDGRYPGKIFDVGKDQTIAVEWINEIDGGLPFSVLASGYNPLNAHMVHPENEPGQTDGGIDPNKPIATPCLEDSVAKALPAWTVVHLHGARVAPDSDGWTENAFLARGTQSASQHSLYPPQARSMMLWYHDHAYMITRLNVFAGLAGGWIIRDDEERKLNLPSGEFELPLIIQDRNLETDGDVLTGRLMHKVETDTSKFIPTSQDALPQDTAEFFGPFTVVNGSLWPSVRVQPKPYRFRMLNGSNARTYQLFLVDDSNTIRNELIRQIGTDAGLMAEAVAIDKVKYAPSQPTCPNLPKGLILAPAERADLIVDFQCAPGQSFRWVNVAAAPFDGIYAADDSDPTGDTLITPVTPPELMKAMGARLPFPEVMRFVVENGPAGSPFSLPSPLSSFKRWTHDSDELKGHNHRWLALNEKVKGADLKEGYLFFNELIAMADDDPRKEDFTIFTTEGRTTAQRFLNRPVFFRSPINFYPEAGNPEVWHILNFSADSHPIHLHLVDFQLLTRNVYTVAGSTAGSSIVAALNSDGLLVADPITGPHALIQDSNRPNDPNFPSGIDPNEVGWKDTVRVNPNEMVTIAMIFEGFTGRFMYHCHILEHEDMDMMRPMVVVPPPVGQYADEMMMMTGDDSDMHDMSHMSGM
jgi:spore coat protein A